ncbi:TIR domain-containing protein [Leifsonia sp. NPDC056665]|uniref:TIR domain-containing protein n=1 Tax=Leifsonia sp. NPDC056665 TaxID=3345901 RepID=UPI0036B01122
MYPLSEALFQLVPLMPTGFVRRYLWCMRFAKVFSGHVVIVEAGPDGRDAVEYFIERPESKWPVSLALNNDVITIAVGDYSLSAAWFDACGGYKGTESGPFGKQEAYVFELAEGEIDSIDFVRPVWLYVPSSDAGATSSSFIRPNALPLFRQEGTPQLVDRLGHGTSEHVVTAEGDFFLLLPARRAHRGTGFQKDIFLVHGHDDASRNEVENFITRSTGVVPTVLMLEASRGRTIIEKFEKYAEHSAFAVVLMTADDYGAAIDRPSAPRARQNVVFEFGYFVAALTRSNVVALVAAGVEKPSDLAGLVYVDFGKATNWKSELRQEMQAAGIPLLQQGAN